MSGLLLDDSTSDSGRALLDQPGPQGLVVADWAAASTQGRRRERNEDATAHRGPIFAVADGMGGLAHGDHAAAVATESFVDGWFGSDATLPTSELLRSVNGRVRAIGGTDGSRTGCTLTAVRIHQDQAIVLHIGDSRLYRIRSGLAELITTDHNVRSELLAAGVLPSESRASTPLRALTSHLGTDDVSLRVDLRTIVLRDGDRLLLCTDGVHATMDHRALEVRASGGLARTAAEALTERPGADDATAMVLDVAAER